MTFTRMGQWYEMSDCGRFTVCCARVGDLFKFQGWILAPKKGETARPLGTFDDAESARKACAEYAKGAV